MPMSLLDHATPQGTSPKTAPIRRGVAMDVPIPLPVKDTVPTERFTMIRITVQVKIYGLRFRV